jgi:hypothetical protein
MQIGSDFGISPSDYWILRGSVPASYLKYSLKNASIAGT